MRRKLATLATVGAAAVLLSGIKLAAQVQVYPEVFNEVKHDTSPPLSQMNPQAEHGPKHTHKWLKGPIGGRPGQIDPALQNSAGPLVGTTNGLNFLGVGVGLANFLPNAAPPDTNGAAGATQFVQWVNESFAVFNKSTGALVYGPAAGNTLWSGFGGPCESSNDGDIIAQYDKVANRWVMAQPVFTSPYFYCIAVSTTSDATGSYNRYQFQTPSNSTQFPDYPKLGVWPDAYYASFNLFFNGNSFSGAAACAFDRNAMLNGLGATVQCFTNSGEASFLPSDLDGSTPPPAGSPDYFVDLGSFSSLNLYKFHVDFTTPANSTFTGPTSIPVAAFTEACGGGTCIPESGGSKLDSLGDRLMYRLAYRNFGDHEALVVSHSVDPSGTGSGVTGVRWYEIRSPGSSPTIFQQGTYQPDSSYRWMPSIAMDKSGDIAVGYSASSSSIHPAIRYTGRVPGDPLGTLEAENSIVEGGGSQDGGLTRWGDYSSMAIDPVDDCTFWYTNEYELSSGSFNWSTRIASFKFPSCGGPPTPDFTISAAPSSQTVVQGNSTSYTVNIGALNGFTGTVSFGASGLGSGATASFSPTTVTGGSGSTTMTVNTASGAATGTFTVAITGTSGALVHTATVTLVVNPPPDFSISASPGSRTVNQGSSTTYTVTIGALNGFNGTVSFGTSGLSAGASASFSPTTVTGSGSTTMTVTATSGAVTGSVTVTITGTSGALSHTTTVSLNVVPPADFSISATPSSQTVTQGNGTTYTATVTAINGFGGTVNFSASGLPSGATASFNPSSVTGSGSSTVTVTTAGSTPTGTFTLTFTGTAGALVHSTTVSLVVNAAPPPDFTISASPGSRTVNQGANTTYTVTIGAVNGFGGTVSFGASGLGSGASASFSPTTVTGSGSTTLTVSTTASAATGTFTVTITGTSGALSHPTTVTFVVNSAPDFSLSASPASQTVKHGSSTTYSVTVGALNGFSGTVNFSVSGLPTHANGNFSPSSVTSSGSTTLTVSTNRKTPTGTRTLTITGTSGALTRSTTVSLTVD